MLVLCCFFNFISQDPSDQFIFPEGDKHRGRFERSFSEIGSMVIGGIYIRLDLILIY